MVTELDAWPLRSTSRHSVQVRAIEGTVARANETVASLKETATHDFGRGSALQLTSAVNEMAASGEQVNNNTAKLNEMLVGTVSAVEELTVSIQNVASQGAEMTTPATSAKTATAEIAASAKSMSLETEALSTSVSEAAASIEEMARSIQGVASNASEMTAAAESTATAINEMASSIEEVELHRKPDIGSRTRSHLGRANGARWPA